MSLNVGIGIGQGDDSHVAGVTAAQEALDRLGSSRPNLVMIFSSVRFDQEKMLSGVNSVIKNTLILGCSSSGTITTDGVVKKDAVVVIALESDSIQFFAGIAPQIKDSPHEAGKTAAQIVKDRAGGHLDAFFVFPDVLAGNGADILRGVLDVLGPHFPVIGGAPGDNLAFTEAYQYLDTKVYTGAVLGLGLVGHFKIGVGVGHGWMPLGLPRKVTKSSGSIIYEVDHRPAISFYDDYFGDITHISTNEKLAKVALLYPIGMKQEGITSDEMLIRSVLSADANGAITCTAEIPEGSEIQLMIGSDEDALKITKSAARRAYDQLDGAEPKITFVFNSSARSKLLATRTQEEMALIQEPVGKNVPMVGFYTFGEIAPRGGEVRIATRCIPTFHNETVVICMLGE